LVPGSGSPACAGGLGPRQRRPSGGCALGEWAAPGWAGLAPWPARIRLGYACQAACGPPLSIPRAARAGANPGWHRCRGRIAALEGADPWAHGIPPLPLLTTAVLLPVIRPSSPGPWSVGRPPLALYWDVTAAWPEAARQRPGHCRGGTRPALPANGLSMRGSWGGPGQGRAGPVVVVWPTGIDAASTAAAPRPAAAVAVRATCPGSGFIPRHHGSLQAARVHQTGLRSAS